MNKNSISYLLLLGQVFFFSHTVVDAIAPKYVACVAAICGIGCILGCATCPGAVVGCAPLILCFDDETSVTTPYGDSLLGDINEGDMVMTFDQSGEPKWTEVTGIHKIEKQSEGIELIAATDDGSQHSLVMTPNHGIHRISDNNDIEVVAVNKIKSGNFVKVSSLGQSNKAKVISTKNVALPSRTAIFTQEGTVLANGIHAATSCTVGDDVNVKEYHIKFKQQQEEADCVRDLLEKKGEPGYQQLFRKIRSNRFGEIGPADMFEFIVNTCSGLTVSERLLELLPNAEHLPMALQNDPSALLHMLYLYDGYSVEEAINMNPYLCGSGCAAVVPTRGPNPDVTATVRRAFPQLA